MRTWVPAVQDNFCPYRSDLLELPFTTQCIKEAFRMHSPVPFIAREVEKEFELDGITLKPGTFIDVIIDQLNHNEHVWGTDHWVGTQRQEGRLPKKRLLKETTVGCTGISCA